MAASETVSGAEDALFRQGQPGVWFLSPEQLPTKDATSVHLLVAEVGCASGEGAAGRMLPPVVTFDGHKVVIGVETRPRGDATCPSHPLASLTVQLGEPLGNGTLVDANGSFDDDLIVPPSVQYGQAVVVPPAG